MEFILNYCKILYNSKKIADGRRLFLKRIKGGKVALRRSNIFDRHSDDVFN